jgi:hypothetical protein
VGSSCPTKSGNTIADVFYHAPYLGTVCMSGVIRSAFVGTVNGFFEDEV